MWIIIIVGLPLVPFWSTHPLNCIPKCETFFLCHTHSPNCPVLWGIPEQSWIQWGPWRQQTETSRTDVFSTLALPTSWAGQFPCGAVLHVTGCWAASLTSTPWTAAVLCSCAWPSKRLPGGKNLPVENHGSRERLQIRAKYRGHL